MHPDAAIMSAAVVTAPAEARVDKIPVPEPAADCVRVRLEGCGVCGSNLAPWEGRPWFQYPLAPGEPGHEGWGIVDAVGPRVSTVRPGDRVALISQRAFAEYDIAQEEAIVKLPPELNGKPFPGEALGCAMNIFKRSGIQARETVAIVGVGFLGALLAGLAAGAGARVIAISRRPFALEIAAHFGAQHTIPLNDPGPVIEQVKKMTQGAGCDCVIEAVGRQGPLDLASELTRERGRLVIAGYHQDGSRQVNMQLWNWRGLDVINAHERDPAIYADGVRAAAEAVTKGRLNPEPLYTDIFPLDRISDAFNAMKQRPQRFMKALVML
jgi:threonine dehydrogenase-like Zn-dependent dehydrogenase